MVLAKQACTPESQLNWLARRAGQSSQAEERSSLPLSERHSPLAAVVAVLDVPPRGPAARRQSRARHHYSARGLHAINPPRRCAIGGRCAGPGGDNDSCAPSWKTQERQYNLREGHVDTIAGHMSQCLTSAKMSGALVVVALAIVQSARVADAHGAVVDPPPRQAIDRNLPPWNGPVPKALPNVDKAPAWCAVAGEDGQLSGQNAQACFWFSNGCAVGCPKCDGNARGPIPGCGNQTAANPPTPWGRNKVGPNGVVCTPEESTGVKPTMCDPNLRSINRHAECGGPLDWYYYSPWRYPGYAPIIDPCGVAGGHRPPKGPFGGIYFNTSHASLGDYGSVVLPAMPSNTSWKAGATVQVTWTIEANVSHTAVI